VSHSCRSMLCDEPHYSEHSETCSCDICHAVHQENGIQDYQDCSCCEDQMILEQELGIRCVHGNHIPYTQDPRDKGRFSMITDRECPKCQIDYGVAFGWEDIARAA
jgi:hypothetical protein